MVESIKRGKPIMYMKKRDESDSYYNVPCYGFLGFAEYEGEDLKKVMIWDVRGTREFIDNPTECGLIIEEIPWELYLLKLIEAQKHKREPIEIRESECHYCKETKPCFGVETFKYYNSGGQRHASSVFHNLCSDCLSNIRWARKGNF